MAWIFRSMCQEEQLTWGCLTGFCSQAQTGFWLWPETQGTEAQLPRCPPEHLYPTQSPQV